MSVPADFVKSPLSTGQIDLYHRNGVAWFDAPLPRRFHKCEAQTIGYVNYVDLVQRCACGATRMPSRWHGWAGKNERRS